MKAERKCLECDYMFPEDSIRTYCNNCEPRDDFDEAREEIKKGKLTKWKPKELSET